MSGTPSAEALREFLRENVTVVAPGETLVIRAPDLSPAQMREVSYMLNGADADGTPWYPFRTVVVPGDGFAVVKDADVRDVLRDLVREEIRAEVARQEAAYPLRTVTLP